MIVRRLRGGEWLALTGAVALLVALFLDWFDLERPLPADDSVVPALAELNTTGWSSLGWLLVALLVAVLVAVAWLAVATMRTGAVAQAVGAGVITAVLATVAFAALVARVLIDQPGLGAGVRSQFVTLEGGAWLGLGGALLIAIGGWWSIADERTGARESTYAPPAPRPAPPAT